MPAQGGHRIAQARRPEAEESTVRTMLLSVLLAVIGMIGVTILGGCQSGGKASPGLGVSDIAGTWTLFSVQGEDIASVLPAGATPPSMEIGADGRISGFSGINRFNTSIDAAALGSGELALRPMAMTMMAGPPELMQLERRFVDAMQNANQIELSGDTLQLLDAGTPMVTFTRG